jgi:hypothetical protein
MGGATLWFQARARRRWLCLSLVVRRVKACAIESSGTGWREIRRDGQDQLAEVTKVRPCQALGGALPHSERCGRTSPVLCVWLARDCRTRRAAPNLPLGPVHILSFRRMASSEPGKPV